MAKTSEVVKVKIADLDETKAMVLDAFRQGYERAAKDIAEKIRAELVCCDVYEQQHGKTHLLLRGHDICFWGEASARLAEDVASSLVKGDSDAKVQ